MLPRVATVQSWGMATRQQLRTALSALVVAPLIAVSSISPVGALDAPTVNDPTLETETSNSFASACPELTDSVTRLYSAFFGRAPDVEGWEYWMSVYVSPTTNLESIANDFVLSDEFQTTYGSLTNTEFVTLVYGNVMGRVPDQAGLEHWTASLDAGYSRGAVMIAFSESAEYVQLTGTWPPLAGYLQWYSRPLQFACGTGPVIVTPEWEADYADLMVWNQAPDPVGYRIGVDTPQGILMDDFDQLSPSSYSIFWNMEIRLVEGRALVVEVPDRNDVFWTVVFYDSPHAPDRSPYTDGFGVFSRTDDDATTGSSLLATVDGEAAVGFADWSR